MPYKPSEKEEEFFKRQEFEQMKKLALEQEKRLKEEEKKNAKALHFMKCPKCGMNLTEIDFKGVRIDKCFTCEGIFMDKGELESILKTEDAGLVKKIFKVFTD